MVDRDVIFEKVKQIQHSLKRIHDKVGDDVSRLGDLDIEDIVVLNLQRAIQSTIDLAAHVIADEGLGLPSDLKENFVLLAKAEILSGDLSERLQSMVGFRNIAVHEYAAINKDVLAAVVTKDLADIEACYTAILQHFRLA